ncbi:MAG: hypothetical protein MK135_11400 [Polyangiaceae bacterium]|nr:hypothetical protein [Polyangiaceae bacterium]
MMGSYGVLAVVFLSFVFSWLGCGQSSLRQKFGLSLLVGAGVYGAMHSLFEVGSSLQIDWPFLLPFIVLFPLLASFALLFLPSRAQSWPLRLCRIALWLEFLLVGALLLERPPQGWAHLWVGDWVPAIGARFHVATDALSSGLAFFSVLIILIASYSCSIPQGDSKKTAPAVLLCASGALGSFFALDLVQFTLFSQLFSVGCSIWIASSDRPDAARAARAQWLLGTFGSVVFLGVAGYLATIHQRLTGWSSFDYLSFTHLKLADGPAHLCYILSVFVAVTRLPIVPMHQWFVHGIDRTPRAALIMLLPVSTALGGYFYLRFVMGLFPGPAGQASVFLVTVLLLIAVLVPSLLAARQKDVFRIFLYLGLAQNGLALVGSIVATPASLQGASLGFFAAQLSLGGLLLMGQAIERRLDVPSLDRASGVLRASPFLGGFTVFFLLATLGLPGTINFTAYFSTLMGCFLGYRSNLGPFGLLQSLLAVGVTLTFAGTCFRMIQVLVGRPSLYRREDIETPRSPELIGAAALALCIVLLGFFPGLWTDYFSPTREAFLRHYREGRTEFVDQERGSPARLLPRRGGPWEFGYPAPPEEVPIQPSLRALSEVSQ